MLTGPYDPFSLNAIWTGLDIQAGPGVDLGPDATRMVFAEPYYDLAISTEVLEHAADWPNIIRLAASAAPLLALTCASLDRPGPRVLGRS